MEMHTAGSLKGGQIVWALAKVKDSFELFGGDRVESYLHFTNFHKYGFSTDVRFTPIRVVCNNTLTLSLNTKVERMVKISHRREFEGDNVKMMLGIAAEKLAKYKEMAQFLGSKRYNSENIVDYFKRVFPVAGGDKTKKEISKNADIALGILETQPGAEFAEQGDTGRMIEVSRLEATGPFPVVGLIRQQGDRGGEQGSQQGRADHPTGGQQPLGGDVAWPRVIGVRWGRGHRCTKLAGAVSSGYARRPLMWMPTWVPTWTPTPRVRPTPLAGT
jgi:hypothetical protein